MAANDLRLTQVNPTNTGNITVNLPYPTTYGLVGLDPATTSGLFRPYPIELGTGLGILSGTTLRVHNLPISEVTNLQTELDGKQPYSTYLDEVAALGGTVNRAIHTDGSGDIVADTQSNFLSWINGVDLGGSYSNPSFITSIAWSKITGKPTTLSGYGITDAYPLSGNPSGFLTGITSGQVTAALGYTPYNGTTNPNSYITTSGARSAISLTTTGTSGAATYNSSTGVINIPNYAVSSGTVTSVGVSSTDLSVSGSPVTTSGNITLNLNTSGITAGTYRTVIFNSKGIAIAGSNPTINNNVSRSLNSNYTISSTQYADVNYSINMNWSVTALLSSSGQAFLEYSTDGGSTWITVNNVGKSIGLITLGLSGTDDLNLTGSIPPNALVRIRTTSTNCTVSYTRGQEKVY